MRRRGRSRNAPAPAVCGAGAFSCVHAAKRRAGAARVHPGLRELKGPRVPRRPFTLLPSAANHIRTQLHLQFVGSGLQSQHGV